MFHDDDETLRRIEEALLAEEELPGEPEDADEPEFDGELDDEDELVVRNYANHYRAYTNQPCDVDLEEYSREVREPRRKRDRVTLYLALLALILTACIVMVILWFLLRVGLL